MVAQKIIELKRIERAKEIETPVLINTTLLPVLPLAESAGWVGIVIGYGRRHQPCKPNRLI